MEKFVSVESIKLLRISELKTGDLVTLYPKRKLALVAAPDQDKQFVVVFEEGKTTLQELSKINGLTFAIAVDDWKVEVDIDSYVERSARSPGGTLLISDGAPVFEALLAATGGIFHIGIDGNDAKLGSSVAAWKSWRLICEASREVIYARS